MPHLTKLAFHLTAVFALCLGAAAARSAEKGSEKEKPFGLDKLVPWTTSRVVGTPDPPDPYDTERVFPHIRFDGSLDMVLSPNGKRWYVTEDRGTIYSFLNDNEAERPELFLDLRRKDYRYPAVGQRRVWSMVFHPRFATNGYVYVCYLENSPQPTRSRISRFTVNLKSKQDPQVCDPDSEFIVCEWLAGQDHFGGCLKFGPDGYLYFPVGDGSSCCDINGSGQDISDFNSSVLRIDVDRTDRGKAYAVPRDNPFVDHLGARPEVWAFGTRNIWKMSFDRATGDLWGGDVGQDLYDWISLIEKGANYGWSIVEGSHPYKPDQTRGPAPISKPVVEHEHFESRSITGGYVYRGSQRPELVGMYIYGDYETGKIWGVRYDTAQRKVLEHRELADTPLHIVGFAEDQRGELFILDYAGTIHRLIPAPPTTHAPADFPRLLSQTGLFESTREHLPVAALVPYTVNSPLWSDGAHKDRFIAVPGGTKIAYRPSGAWTMPEGSVLVKTFSLDMEAGNPTSRRRLETRLLHLNQNHWRGYTYVWNDEQTDAELLSAKGLTRKLTIRDAASPDGVREQNWRFPSRAECTLCHTMPTGFVLGLNTLQMNKAHDYHGTLANQLRTLDHIGIFAEPIADVESASRPIGPGEKNPPAFQWTDLPRLPDPRDPSESLEARARSYLHANCSHCHMRAGGGNSTMELQWTHSLSSTHTIGALPTHGDFGVADAKLIAPGDPDRSIALVRMKLLGHGRMPHVATSVIDREAVDLIQEWIGQMGKKR